MDRTCSIDDCAEPHYGKGYCRSHYMVHARPPCELDECDKPRKGARWCPAHERRARLFGDPTARASDGRPRSCSVETCDGKPFGHGWCARHWESWSKYGDPLDVERRRAARLEARKGLCSIDSCESPVANGRGWCTKHYTRWLRHGDPLADMRDQKNRYEVAADGTHILTMLDRQGREHPVLFDAADLELVRARRWHLSKQGYAITFTLHRDGKASRGVLRMHRVMLGLTTGDDCVDHRNGNRLDNRRSNLRVTTPLVNGANQAVENGHGSSRFRGVSWDRHRERWVAYQKVNYRKYHLGGYSTEVEAAEAVARFRREQGLPAGY